MTDAVTCPLCGRTMRRYGRHFVLEHGDTPAPIGALRVAVALAHADRVIVERAADDVECGRQLSPLDPDDRIATAVELARRGATTSTIGRAGCNASVARHIAELVAGDTIPHLMLT